MGVDNGHALLVESDLAVDNQLDLNYNGRIELNSNQLRMNTGASIAHYDATHYIQTNGVGGLQQEVGILDVIFPIGKSSYNPVTLNNFGILDHFQVRVEDVIYDNGTTGKPITADVVNRTWYMEEQVVGGADVDILLQWNTADEWSLDRNNCQVVQWSGSQWMGPAGTAATTVGNVHQQSITGISSFSQFGVSSAAANPLKNLPQDNNHSNNAQSDLQEAPSNISLENTSAVASMTLFPNPVLEGINLRFEVPTSTVATIRIYSMDGRPYLEQEQVVDPGQVVQIQTLTHLPAGAYVLQAVLEDGSSFQQPFVKANR